MEPEVLQLVVSAAQTAPVVGVLLYLVIRFERRLEALTEAIKTLHTQLTLLLDRSPR